MPDLTPEQFVAKWASAQLKETAGYVSHFDDVCRLVGHAPPAEYDPAGEFFTYQPAVIKTTGTSGFADVWYRGRFAVEYKGKGKSLSDAYQQLLTYREALLNPPLLIVCDFEHWEIHTNFQNTDPVVHRFTNAGLLNPDTRRLLTYAFFSPSKLKPGLNSEAVTKEAAGHFVKIVDAMRGKHAAPEEVARFLTRLIFCLFAEDIDLLPTGPGGETGVFSELVDKTYLRPGELADGLRQLFAAMREGGMFGMTPIPWINGALFEDDAVIRLTAESLGRLRDATRVDWSRVEPSVFGTMFEQVLDPGKRKQLGTHYTSRADIELVVEPVLMRPLRRQWEAARLEARPFRAEAEKAVSEKARRQARSSLAAVRDRMLDALRGVTVLDPACGSGNFLYVSLLALMDLERDVLDDPLWEGLSKPEPGVHPRQLYGIEKDTIAHALASIVVWIGYLQWQFRNGGTVEHRPVLEDLHDHILNMDAIMTLTPRPASEALTPRPPLPQGEGEKDGVAVSEPEWPAATVIVGNPPFLGGKRLRGELGGDYLDALYSLWQGRVDRQADLVTYWFEKARAHIEAGNAQRAGLLATNSIRQAGNRGVLARIKRSGDIFMAWSDEPWVLAGAAVRVSIIGFDDGSEVSRTLDGNPVHEIHTDLSSVVDITQSATLVENRGLASRGIEPGGPFEIDVNLRSELEPEDAGLTYQVINAKDITDRVIERYVIDFGINSSILPDEYPTLKAILQKQWDELLAGDATRKAIVREDWWLFRRSGEKIRQLMQNISRYLATPVTAKHRLFVWVDCSIVPTNSVTAIARSDDYFFGVLHSFAHEWWSLRMGTWLGVGNDPRYTPTTTFETFPFPWPPGHEDTSSPHHAAISAAAAALHAERDTWLHPPGVTDPVALKSRTLTNLYNALTEYRAAFTPLQSRPSPPLPMDHGAASRIAKERGPGGEVAVAPGGEESSMSAAAFAPRLAALHDTLDRAVLAAYGWDDLAEPLRTPAGKDELLRRLLALNGERAG